MPPAPAAVSDRRRAWSLTALTLTSLAVAAFAVTPCLTTSLDALAAEDSGLARGYGDEPVGILVAFSTHVVAAGSPCSSARGSSGRDCAVVDRVCTAGRGA